jgi:hypothetical protein
MDNNIVTTILHQAITSKGDEMERASIISQVIKSTPEALMLKNGYGSLPIHTICQRNTKMKSTTKQVLVLSMISACKEALLEQGGVGKRTPLHVVFTDYVSPRLVQRMIDAGPEACFMEDCKGWLPAHGKYLA